VLFAVVCGKWILRRQLRNAIEKEIMEIYRLKKFGLLCVGVNSQPLSAVLTINAGENHQKVTGFVGFYSWFMKYLLYNGR
jgi:hypothetical protein